MYETACRWEGCSREYDTQEQLVHVSERTPPEERDGQIACYR